uniref:Uncharacterized protein n=1 Tax=Candidatus Kentrum sp. DK TaxID=2126562 RepID=A0A450S5E3_9GAMM|nr:MAG: hypothetical protein BECKDK2373C_GA0170839_101714 [Candidatus Kentron sp. DK]
MRDMDVLFNELSLTGQFLDQNDFAKNGLRPLIGVLKEMEGFSTLLLKKSDVWERMVTPTGTLHSLLVDRTFDGGRLLKSKIEKLTKEPFWDSDSKQRPDSTYLLNGSDIRGSSPAEACERDKVIVSFLSSPTSSDPLPIAWNGVDVPLLNLIRPGRLTEFLWDKKKISFEAYLKARFSGGKLDFSRVDGKMRLCDIQPAEQSLFISTFKKFEGLNWERIHTDTGLDYKEYHGNIDQRYRDRKTYKFRVSRKFRCHGYREEDSFVVIGLETDHKFSDRG